MRGEYCVGGECFGEGDCYEAGCPGSQLCRDGVCVANQCDGIECGDTSFCRDGQCVFSCAGISCAFGQECVDGRCVEVNCGGVVCAEGQACSDETCQPDNCNPEECGPGRTCLGGQCEDDPCSGIECPANQRCEVVDGTANASPIGLSPLTGPTQALRTTLARVLMAAPRLMQVYRQPMAALEQTAQAWSPTVVALVALVVLVVPAVPAVTANRAVMMEPLAVAAMSTLRTTPHPSRCYCYSALAHYAFADAKIA